VIPAHNVIVVQPWHLEDDRNTAMNIAASITALRSFGWCAFSLSYRDLLSEKDSLELISRLEIARDSITFAAADDCIAGFAPGIYLDTYLFDTYLFDTYLFDTYLFDTSRACNTHDTDDTRDTRDTNVNSVLGVRIGSTGK